MIMVEYWGTLETCSVEMKHVKLLEKKNYTGIDPR